MKIQLTCKLFDNDASYFLSPIADISRVKDISVYRDETGIPYPKVNFTTSIFNKTPFRFIYRFFQMLFNKPGGDLVIGIYEMPHGLLALLIGLIKRKPVVISVTGNPKLDRRNKGIRGGIILKILARCNVITFTGSVGRSYYLKEKKYNPEKVFILPTSIDTKKYIDLNLKKIYDIITLGRLSSEKGLDVLINIIAKLKKGFPEIKVGIAGNGILKKRITEAN
jgi:glycosyltransferase involved in cell wall biosynthesis